MHGDKNKADDISWPFYTAIDEVLSNSARASPRSEEPEDEELNPQEFLCVSVAPDAEEDEPAAERPGDEWPLGQGPVFDVAGPTR